MDRQWNFEAQSSQDREQWVTHIDQAIITRLQLLESSRRAAAAAAVAAAGLGGSADGTNSWGQRSGEGGSDAEGVRNSADGKPEVIRVDESMAKSLRSVAGNDACADCGAPGKSTSSLVFVAGVMLTGCLFLRKCNLMKSRTQCWFLSHPQPTRTLINRVSAGNSVARSGNAKVR